MVRHRSDGRAPSIPWLSRKRKRYRAGYCACGGRPRRPHRRDDREDVVSLKVRENTVRPPGSPRGSARRLRRPGGAAPARWNRATSANIAGETWPEPTSEGWRAGLPDLALPRTRGRNLRSGSTCPSASRRCLPRSRPRAGSDGVGDVVEHDEPAVHRHLVTLGRYDPMGMGVTTEAVFGLEEGHVVATL